MEIDSGNNQTLLMHVNEHHSHFPHLLTSLGEIQCKKSVLILRKSGFPLPLRDYVNIKFKYLNTPIMNYFLVIFIARLLIHLWYEVQGISDSLVLLTYLLHGAESFSSN